MFSRTWSTSERKYGVLVEENVTVVMSDGVEIRLNLFRPPSDGKFPVILSAHCYVQQPQTAPIRPYSFSSITHLHKGEEKGRGFLETGDPQFFVRRGYVHAIASVRGTGKSGGIYQWLGPREIQDMVEVIQWFSTQKWCNGNVGMFGVSYLAIIQFLTAAMNPPALKCIFAPWALTDYYRDSYCHGGILRHVRAIEFPFALSNPRLESWTRKRLGQEKFEEAVAGALQDEDIAAVPKLVEILKEPEKGRNVFPADIALNPLDGPFWEERRPRYENIHVPAYLGGCWGNYGLHLPGAFRSWKNLKSPKKLVIGPPIYLDRPVYQLQYESLRWFDYWLKEIDTGIMEEAPVRLFVPGANEWKEAVDWPLPQTKWTPFYLHEKFLLSEHEFWPCEGSDSFEDSPWDRGRVQYCSPPLVEDTEIIGPLVLNLFASTTDREMLLFISFREISPDGQDRLLTRGWLRGSHREVDPELSTRWEPFHPHRRADPVTPGEIYEFRIPLVPTANLFKAGSRFALTITGSEEDPRDALEAIAAGHIKRVSASRITIYHDADHPSHLYVPITKGNLIGTYISGGRPFLNLP